MSWVSLFQFPLRISSSLFGLVNAKSEFVSVVSRAQACDYFLIIQRATFKDKLCWFLCPVIPHQTPKNDYYPKADQIYLFARRTCFLNCPFTPVMITNEAFTS